MPGSLCLSSLPGQQACYLLHPVAIKLWTNLLNAIGLKTD